MNKEEVMRILPHRDNMLLLDEVSLIGKTACGKYRVRGDEWFFGGGAAGKTVPGPLLCEMMGQAACVLLGGDAASSLPYLTSLKGMRFTGGVYPGDLFETECVLVKSAGPFYFAQAKGFVNRDLRVSGEFSFALIK